MLTERHSPYACGNLRARQSGATLLVTLIVLVAMTLTAISLMRSMDTTNIIAGNLAFQQSATRSADTGIESAIAWMEANIATLQNDSFANGYSSSLTNPAAGQSWDNFFTVTLAGRTYTVPTANAGNADAVGNTVTYAIERLCLTANILPTAVGAGCTVTPITTGSVGSSEDAGTVQLNASTQQYYRITSRTVGPHNAKSYVQAIVAL
ncbi:MAG: pilus assembly PilX family protein [Gallionellaceae bacterium]